MDEHVYDVPDLTTDVRYGPRDRGEREERIVDIYDGPRERGEREERIVDIYVSADNLNPDPGTQQDAVQQNTAQQQHGGSEESKVNRARAAAVCLAVLCVILLAGIIGLGVHKSELVKGQEQLQSRNKNLTEQYDQIQSRYDNLTVQNVQIQSKYDNLTKHSDGLQSRYDSVTAERDELKRRLRLCEPHGFTFSADVCYYISNWFATWEQSRQDCRAKQSYLMIINSKEKQDIVNRRVNSNQGVWLGLTDREEEGVWKWVDGTPLNTPTYWIPGQPDNYRDEDCAVSSNGLWYDSSCSESYHWMCERVIQ